MCHECRQVSLDALVRLGRGEGGILFQHRDDRLHGVVVAKSEQKKGFGRGKGEDEEVTKVLTHFILKILKTFFITTNTYSRFISSPKEFLPRYFVLLELSLYVTLNE